MEIIHDQIEKHSSMIINGYIGYVSYQIRNGKLDILPYRITLSNRRTRDCITTGKSGVRLCYKQPSQTGSNLQLCRNLNYRDIRSMKINKKGCQKVGWPLLLLFISVKVLSYRCQKNKHYSNG